MVCRVPKIKLITMINTNFHPDNPIASPPNGNQFRSPERMINATTKSPIPMPCWIFWRDIRETIPAPRTAPIGAAVETDIRVTGSTLTEVMKIKAWTTVGIVFPTFMVPGISRSSTSLKNLKSAVCCAKLPMPSVSRKLVVKPTPRSPGYDLSESDFRFRNTSVK